METDRYSDEYVTTPEERRLFGLSTERIAFSNADRLIARYTTIERNLRLALTAPDDYFVFVDENGEDFIDEEAQAKRRVRLHEQLDVANGVMDEIAHESSATELIEGVEAHLRSVSGN